MDGKIKISVIGGGSSYTPELIEGIISRSEVLPVSEIALVDIPEGEKKLSIIHELSKRMIKKAGLDIKLTSTLNVDEALLGSSYVITQLRVGGLNARALDEKIPLSHNVIGQETTGPGGFAKALRTIPVILSIANKMEKLCPDAYLINFTNPSGIVTEAVNKYSKIKCIGLCNVPINMKREVANIFNVHHDDVYCEFIGLNHLSFIKKVFVKGIDRTSELFEKEDLIDDIVANVPSCPGSMDLIKTLNLIPSPYLNYYYFEKFMLDEEKEDLKNGEGTRAEQVMKIEKELFELYSDPELNIKPPQLSERGGAFYSEAAISLIESIHNNTGDVHVLNVVNNGAISSLPNSSVIETNCIVTNSGARPIATGELPPEVKPLITHVKAYEEFTIKAAYTGSRDIAFLALLNHPLVHGADNAKILVDELLDAHKKYLPLFFGKEI